MAFTIKPFFFVMLRTMMTHTHFKYTSCMQRGATRSRTFLSALKECYDDPHDSTWLGRTRVFGSLTLAYLSTQLCI